MEIEDMFDCHKCGVVLNKSIVLKPTANRSPNDYTGYWETEYVGYCPVCEQEITVWM